MLGEKWMLIDSKRLMDCIWNRKLSIKTVADFLEISEAKLYDKIFIYRYFDKKEVLALEKLLNLSHIERESIFKM